MVRLESGRAVNLHIQVNHGIQLWSRPHSDTLTERKSLQINRKVFRSYINRHTIPSIISGNAADLKAKQMLSETCCRNATLFPQATWGQVHGPRSGSLFIGIALTSAIHGVHNHWLKLPRNRLKLPCFRAAMWRLCITS